MNEVSKTWACSHAIPVDPCHVGDVIEAKRHVAKEIKLWERCPTCGLSYSEHKQLTQESK